VLTKKSGQSNNMRTGIDEARKIYLSLANFMFNSIRLQGAQIFGQTLSCGVVKIVLYNLAFELVD
jgi:hypothetical protein